MYTAAISLKNQLSTRGILGLQIGYFLHNAGRNYLIMEKSNTAGTKYVLYCRNLLILTLLQLLGSFFLRYPRHRRLLSINKRYTGQLLCNIIYKLYCLPPGSIKWYIQYILIYSYVAIASYCVLSHSQL